MVKDNSRPKIFRTLKIFERNTRKGLRVEGQSGKQGISESGIRKKRERDGSVWPVVQPECSKIFRFVPTVE